jgi:hypothetical protein
MVLNRQLYFKTAFYLVKKKKPTVPKIQCWLGPTYSQGMAIETQITASGGI